MVATTAALLLSIGLGTVTVPINVGFVIGAKFAAMFATKLVVAIRLVALPAGGSVSSVGTPLNDGLAFDATPLMSAAVIVNAPVLPLTLVTGA